MRFMMMIKSSAESESGALPSEAVLAEMGRYNESLMKAGALLAGDGLKPSAQGCRVRYSAKAKQFSAIDGPFAETKELLAGFWLIRVNSKAEAIAWAERVPGSDGELELRPLFEMEDFPADPAEQPDGWRDQEQQFRDQAAASAPPRKPGTKRFMVFLKSGAHTESDALPTEQVMSEMGALMGELVQQGALLSGEGLKPSKYGARVKQRGKERVAIDGPFTESKELIAGYCIIQVRSRDEAIGFAKRWLQIHVDGLGEASAEAEVRELFELEDFPVDASEKPGGWRDRERAFRDQHGG